MKKLILPALAGFVALGWAAAPAAAYDRGGYGGGDYCREYTRQVMIGGRMETSYGMACLQPDGQWLIDGDRRRPLPAAAVYEPDDRFIVAERRPVYIIERDDDHRHGKKHKHKHKHHHDRDYRSYVGHDSVRYYETRTYGRPVYYYPVYNYR